MRCLYAYLRRSLIFNFQPFIWPFRFIFPSNRFYGLARPKATSLALILFFLILLSACGGQKGKVRIRGKFENLPQADLIIYSPDGGLSTVDTLHLVKGKFDYQTNVENGLFTYVIIYPNFSTLSFQAHSGSDVHIKGDALSLSQVQVEGADSILPIEEHKSRNPIAIGKRLPKSKIIQQKAGKYLLIAFWAEWKHGSSVVNYNIRQALREHSDSLTAFSYSLDLEPSKTPINTSSTSTEEKIDSTQWCNYCDYTGWGGPLLLKFGIRNIPQIILVNPKGIVVAMGNDYNKDIKPEIEKIQQKQKKP